MRVLISGITGFAGSHLAEVCVAQGADVWGLAYTPGPHPHLAHLGDRVQLHSTNITDEDGMQAALAAILPDRIFHLAAQAHVPTAWSDPAATLATNILGQLHVILAMQQHVPTARMLAVSSSNVYGMVEEKDLPVSETAPLRPADPYAVSKVGQEMLALQYWQSHGLAHRACAPVQPHRAPPSAGLRDRPLCAGIGADGSGSSPAQVDSGQHERQARLHRRA